jgi:hypothetical protein
LGVARRDIGTGMRATAVAASSAAVDLGSLRAYWEAVGARTVVVVGGLDRAALAEIPDVARLRGVAAAEVLASHAGNTVRAYAGQTRGWLLGHLALMHAYEHGYQAAITRRLVAGPPGSARPRR